MKEICPLLSIGRTNPQGFPVTIPCLKDDCQWWIQYWEFRGEQALQPEKGICSVKAVAVTLMKIQRQFNTNSLKEEVRQG